MPKHLDSVAHHPALRRRPVVARSFSASCASSSFTRVTAAVCRQPRHPLRLEPLLLCPPRADEVRVRLVATGICHTDVACRDQHIPTPMPLVLGHEGCGVVEEVGPAVKHVLVGDHVIMSYASCGACRNCLAGKPSYCVHHRLCNFGGKRLDGSVTHHTLPPASPLGAKAAPARTQIESADLRSDEVVYGCFFRQSSFATLSIASAANVFKVDKHLPLASLAPLGCGVQTGAGAVLNTLQARPGSSIAIFGVGAVGFSALLAASVVSCETIIAVDLHASRLALAKQNGATHCIEGGTDGIAERIRDITRGGLDYSIDTTGNPSVLRTAFESLRPLGICALVGGSPPGSAVQLDMLPLLLGRTIRGVIQGDSISSIFLPQLLQLYQRGRFPFDKMITFYDSLADVNRAIEDAHSGRVIKPVLHISAP